MSIERFNLKKNQLMRIRKILVNLLNSVSYRSKERDSLISLAAVDIVNKCCNEQWLDDLKEFLEKNSKVPIRAYSKYYYKDIYEKLYNDFYLSDFKKDLDLFATTVREFKQYSKSLLTTKKPIKTYFKEKGQKKV